ncbi:MAG: SDR family NAD(P)-dependent oxidoreductase [Pseudomonadota bacterium]|nr:SDR family NAD(P)-dependent oxidoreductase [Pseudomonadota bacterium]
MAGAVMAVTGGSGFLGRAVIEAARGAGWEAAAIDHAATPPGADEGAFRIGGVDLADPAAAARAVGAVVARFGRLDALVNVAGGFRWQTLADGPFESWAALYAMNVLTAAAASKAALPHLAASGRGAIVNVGAMGAVKAAAGMGAYAAAKAGVHRLTEALAEEWKGRVRVNAILPSILDTPANRADMPGADPAASVSLAEAARVILFLAGEDASAITGALLPVTGRV